MLKYTFRMLKYTKICTHKSHKNELGLLWLYFSLHLSFIRSYIFDLFSAPNFQLVDVFQGKEDKEKKEGCFSFAKPSFKNRCKYNHFFTMWRFKLFFTMVPCEAFFTFRKRLLNVTDLNDRERCSREMIFSRK